MTAFLLRAKRKHTCFHYTGIYPFFAPPPLPPPQKHGYTKRADALSGTKTCYNHLMRLKQRRTWSLLLLLILGTALALSLSASRLFAAEDVRYFPQTGHTVQGDFLDFYRAWPEAALLFGYPITEAFQRQGQTMQYFQRALFQQGPNHASPTLANLGRYFYEHPGKGLHREPLSQSFLNGAGCKAFPDVEGALHPVCYEFLRFYQQHRTVLGQVVSDPLLENGVPVQYFEEARLEYHAREGRVVLSNLGEWYFQQNEHDPQLLRPLPAGGEAPLRRAVLTLRVMATITPVLAHPGDQVHLIVWVTDQLGQPLEGATVQLQFTNTLGEPLTAPFTPQAFTTDNDGCLNVWLPVPTYRGHIAVRIRATFDGITGEAETAFRVWH